MFRRSLSVLGLFFLAASGIEAKLAEDLEGSNDELGYCVDEHMIEQRRLVTLDKKVKQRSKFRTDTASKQAVLIDVSKYSEPIVGRYSLSIELNIIQVKSYLKNEKLVLVGDGFNDEALMNTAYHLEFKGFRDVNVLVNGRRSLAITDLDKKAFQPLTSKLHFVDAVTALSAAATSSLKNEYYFLLLGDDLPQLNDYGIERSIVLDSKSQYISELLNRKIDEILNTNGYTKLVLVLRDNDQKKHILANDKLINTPGLWVVTGGADALARAISNTKIAPVKLRDHKFACRTR
jgi:hypothetical protein